MRDEDKGLGVTRMSQYLCVGGDLDGWVVVLKEDQDSISFGDEKSRKTYVVYSCPFTEVSARCPGL